MLTVNLMGTYGKQRRFVGKRSCLASINLTYDLVLCIIYFSVHKSHMGDLVRFFFEIKIPVSF